MAISAFVVGTTAFSIGQQAQAAKKQEKAASVQRSQQISEQRRQDREQMIKARIARARVLNTAEQAGIGGSSVVQSTQSNITNQLSSNLAFGAQQVQSASLIDQWNNSAAQNIFNAQVGQSLANLALTYQTVKSQPAQTKK